MDSFWLVIFSLIAVWFGYRALFWCYQGYLVTKHPSYIVPEKSALTRIAVKILAALATQALIGKVQAYGRKNAKFKGRLLILPNHTHQLDFAVAERALPVSYKQVGTLSEVGKGIRAPFGAWAGFIAIDTTGGKANSLAIAERTVRAYARALTFRSLARLLIFPQGVLVHGGHIPADSKTRGSIRTGSVRGAQLAQKTLDALKKGDAESIEFVRTVHGAQANEVIKYYRRNTAALDEPLAILPVFIDYHRRHKDSDVVGIFSKMFGGASVYIGEPILASSLPEDPRQASEVVRQAIEALSPKK